MVDGIAISVAGLQNAAVKADKAARSIASETSISGLPADIVDITSGADAIAAEAVAANATEGGLEGSIVAMKTAALMYKANAEALSIQLEAQKDAFEQLI